MLRGSTEVDSQPLVSNKVKVVGAVGLVAAVAGIILTDLFVGDFWAALETVGLGTLSLGTVSYLIHLDRKRKGRPGLIRAIGARLFHIP